MKISKFILATIALCVTKIHGLKFVEHDPATSVGNLKEAKFCENIVPNTQIYTLKVEAFNSPVSFAILTPEFNQHVDIISASHGEAYLLLKEPFDREAKSTFQVFIEASDSTAYVFQESTVTILDSNDHIPTFSLSTYVINVFEHPWAPRNLGEVVVFDPDNGYAGLASVSTQNDSVLSVEDTGRANVFLLQAQSTEQLNYEQIRSISKTITAYDRGNEGDECGNIIQLSSEATVLIKLDDGPDQPPFFITAPYTKKIKETNNKGDLVLKVDAQDGDRGLNWKIEYFIVSDPVIHNIFAIDNLTGEITIIGDVDRELEASLKNGGVYKFLVMAKEVVPNDSLFNNSLLDFPFNTTAQVTIEVLDENDNKPEFYWLNGTDSSQKQPKSHFTAEIDEFSSKSIAVPNLNIFVQDIDDTPNAQFAVFLESGFDVFNIQPASITGEALISLTVKDSTLLDCKINQYIIVNIAAEEIRDGVTTISKAVVNITINDVNNHSPVFEENINFINISENTPIQTEITMMKASDEDAGENAQITYKLDNSDKFKINQTTGVISIAKELDREIKKQHFLTITASDGGGRFTTTPIEIIVTDFNDNAPKFQRESYYAIIKENASDFNYEVVFNAHDMDDENTVNSKFVYSIISGDTFGNFKIQQPSINQTEAKLLVSVAPDLEKLPSTSIECSGRGSGSIFLTIMVEDKGLPSLNSTVPVEVSIEDINDHAPEFSEITYNTTVPEHSPVDTNVTKIFASDFDACEPNNLIDYLIGNNGNASSSSSFYIEATSDQQATLKVRNSQLDRDDTPSFWVEVIAVDRAPNSLRGSAMIHVMLTDINNKPPVFNLTTLEPLEVAENESVDSIIREILATDQDEDSNLLYHITDITCKHQSGMVVEKDCSGAFVIETNNDLQLGQLKVKSTLDREEVAIYHVKVKVEDVNQSEDHPHPLIEAELIISVTDINDNHPYFYSEVKLQVNEEEVNAFVGQVTAFDEDMDKNAEIVYTVAEEFEEWIRIDSGTGQIYTKKAFDREQNGDFINITLIAKDRGEPPLNSSHVFTVGILDTNDNNPQFFANISTALKTMENESAGTFVYQVQAHDNDTGDNAKIQFQLTEGYNNFEINNVDGSITTKVVFDREKRDNYQLQVVVIDGGASPRSSEINLNVEILDIDDEGPYYTSSNNEMNAHVIEEQVGYIFDSVPPALDNDKLPENQHNFYFVVGGNGSQAFSINSTTGEMFTTKTLDRETQDLYDLVVQVSAVPNIENETPNKVWEDVKYDKTMFHAIIQVLDENDHSPVFSKELYKTAIPFDAEPNPNAVLFQVMASDNDVGVNSQLTFSILQISFVIDGKVTETPGTFTILQSDKKGDIYLVAPIIENTDGYYDIYLKVNDRNESHVDYSNVFINIVQTTETVVLYSRFSPTAFASMQSEFVSDFSALLNATVIITKVIPDTESLNTSIIYFYAINEASNEIIPRQNVIYTLNQPSSISLLNKYGITSSGDEESIAINNATTNWRIALISTIALFIIVFLLYTIILCCYLKRTNKRLQETKQKESGHLEILTDEKNLVFVPNTNNFEDKFNPLSRNDNETSDDNDSQDMFEVGQTSDFGEIDFGDGQNSNDLAAALNNAARRYSTQKFTSLFE